MGDRITPRWWEGGGWEGRPPPPRPLNLITKGCLFNVASGWGEIPKPTGIEPIAEGWVVGDGVGVCASDILGWRNWLPPIGFAIPVIPVGGERHWFQYMWSCNGKIVRSVVSSYNPLPRELLKRQKVRECNKKNKLPRYIFIKSEGIFSLTSKIKIAESVYSYA